jgi:hypothetical protein
MEKILVDRSKFYKIDDVSVFDLQLDAFNPRIRHGVDQNDCIARIAGDRESFMRLVRDIATNGLSPQHVLVSKAADGKLIVRDGNRRATALKLLNRPDLALPDEPLRNLVARVRAVAAAPIAEKVSCLACDDEVTIVDYLRRLHTGENAGIGQVDWSALLISLFNSHAAISDQNRRAAQLVLWMEEHGKHVENSFPITTLTRLLNAETLDILGFGISADKLTITLSATEAYALASRVIDDIAANVINVTRGGPASVYTLDAALEYVRTVRRQIGPAEPNQPSSDPHGLSGATGEAGVTSTGDDNGSFAYVANDSSSNSSGGSAARGTSDFLASSTGSSSVSDDGSSGSVLNKSATAGVNRGNRTSVKPAWDRPRLFGRRKTSRPDFAIPLGREKVETIVGELRELDPNATPMAVTMLLRGLLELSDLAYREAHGLPDKRILHSNIAASADHMKNVGLLNEGEHLVILSYTRSEQEIMHVKSIQKYIHSDTFHPNGQRLNTMWDEMGVFVRACWEGVTRVST